MVAVWLHHHRLVHRQLGRFPDRVSTRNAGRIAGGLVEAVQDPIFSSERIGDDDLLREDGLHRGEVLRVRFTIFQDDRQAEHVRVCFFAGYGRTCP